jgi:hypothetical protein
MGVDCKFLNFGVNIAKALKLHGLKVNFPLKKAFCARMEKNLLGEEAGSISLIKGVWGSCSRMGRMLVQSSRTFRKLVYIFFKKIK